MGIVRASGRFPRDDATPGSCREKESEMCLLPRVIETSRQVFVPNVGAIIRVERCAEDGEPLGLEYRWPTRLEPLADDPMRPVVLVVSAAHADSSDPTR
jgi:hypothetical protein